MLKIIQTSWEAIALKTLSLASVTVVSSYSTITTILISLSALVIITLVPPFFAKFFAFFDFDFHYFRGPFFFFARGTFCFSISQASEEFSSTLREELPSSLNYSEELSSLNFSEELTSLNFSEELSSSLSSTRFNLFFFI